MQLALNTTISRWSPRKLPRYLVGVWMLTGLAWVALGSMHLLPDGRAVGGSGLRAFRDFCIPAGSTLFTADSIRDDSLNILPMFLAMSIAMMLPAALPMAKYIASITLRCLSSRAVAVFLVSYMLLWMIYSVAASVLIVLLVRAAQQALESVSGVVPVAWSPGAAAMAVTLLVAALWQGLPLKRRIERASYSPRPFPLHGIAADAAILRFGLTHGAQCVAACWPLMLVGPAVGSFAWMVAMAALVWIEKTQRYASRLKQPSALVLAAASVFYILAALN